ncbi:hypothetical protein [Caldibacillus debilis]|uniref:hypothetical protein n=1 Tax=Caldibacillus debilis TaxID=301148 RepID=UPI0011C3F10F|nr:hypothetical protein [Caldibacillus debilis]
MPLQKLPSFPAIVEGGRMHFSFALEDALIGANRTSPLQTARLSRRTKTFFPETILVNRKIVAPREPAGLADFSRRMPTRRIVIILSMGVLPKGCSGRHSGCPSLSVTG